MIKEMQQNGCTVGSHSVSHPFPSRVKSHAKKGPEAYKDFLKLELGMSRKFLKSRFGEPVTTYVYPGGYYTEEMFTIGDEAGYEFYFTVKPGKVRRDSPNHTLPSAVIWSSTFVYSDMLGASVISPKSASDRYGVSIGTRCFTRLKATSCSSRSRSTSTWS